MAKNTPSKRTNLATRAALTILSLCIALCIVPATSFADEETSYIEDEVMSMDIPAEVYDTPVLEAFSDEDAAAASEVDLVAQAYQNTDYDVIFNAGGPTLTDRYGITRAQFVSYMRMHMNDNLYLGAAYHPDYDGNRYNGFDCAEFVHFMVNDALAYYGKPENFTPTDDGWWDVVRGVEYRTIIRPSYSELAAAIMDMQREGYLLEGDIVWFWNLGSDAYINDGWYGRPNNGWITGSKPDHHIGIWVGYDRTVEQVPMTDPRWKNITDPMNWWHSNTYGRYNVDGKIVYLDLWGNKISIASPGNWSSPIGFTIIKWSGPVVEIPKVPVKIWKYERGDTLLGRNDTWNLENSPTITYGLYSDQRCTQLVAQTTNDISHANGATVYFPSVDANKAYYLREISATAPYLIDPTIYKVVVDARAVTRVTPVNRSANNEIYDSTSTGLDIAASPDASYTLYYDPACTIPVGPVYIHSRTSTSTAAGDDGTRHLNTVSGSPLAKSYIQTYNDSATSSQWLPSFNDDGTWCFESLRNGLFLSRGAGNSRTADNVISYIDDHDNANAHIGSGWLANEENMGEKWYVELVTTDEEGVNWYAIGNEGAGVRQYLTVNESSNPGGSGKFCRKGVYLTTELTGEAGINDGFGDNQLFTFISEDVPLNDSTAYGAGEMTVYETGIATYGYETSQYGLYPDTTYYVKETKTVGDEVVETVRPVDAGTSESVLQLDVYAGASRYDVSRMIADSLTADGASYNGIVVVSGENDKYPDAISASGLAGLLDYPLVVLNGAGLTAADELTLAIYAAAGPAEGLDVIVVGGTATITPEVEAALANIDANAEVDRISGDNRYLVNEAVYTYGAERGTWGDTVFVARGDNFPDALTVAPYLVANKCPIILVDPSATELTDGQVAIAQSASQGIVLGGTSSVTTDLENNLASLCGTTNRLGGADRYEASANIVNWELGQGMTLEGAGFATGAKFPDALGSGFILGTNNSVLFLVDPSGNNSAIYSVLRTGHPTRLNVFGGTASVSDSDYGQIAQAALWSRYAVHKMK